MPILDFGADHTWFVMPWAQATAAQRQELLREAAELRLLVNALASVLATAHEHGWLHRDIKPSNILHFDGRWALADWGIVRRPRGQTTKVGRTGLYIGTEGFAAPELSDTPHEATASSDIYSIGRVIAWAITSELPKANLPLLPPPGPWRTVVRATTHQDPRRRPQTISELLTLIDREHAAIPEDPFETAQALLETAGTGDTAAADTLMTLVKGLSRCSWWISPRRQMRCIARLREVRIRRGYPRAKPLGSVRTSRQLGGAPQLSSRACRELRDGPWRISCPSARSASPGRLCVPAPRFLRRPPRDHVGRCSTSSPPHTHNRTRSSFCRCVVSGSRPQQQEQITAQRLEILQVRCRPGLPAAARRHRVEPGGERREEGRELVDHGFGDRGGLDGTPPHVLDNEGVGTVLLDEFGGKEQCLRGGFHQSS
ncbi:hypothetical protein [Streptomyces sp. NPDC048155]|uniref:protein kinase domain-containing protein n=1 Tax=unclassified Streptomyces TaxID=2593676 RepID=UPI0033F9E5B1